MRHEIKTWIYLELNNFQLIVKREISEALIEDVL